MTLNRADTLAMKIAKLCRGSELGEVFVALERNSLKVLDELRDEISRNGLALAKIRNLAKFCCNRTKEDEGATTAMSGDENGVSAALAEILRLAGQAPTWKIDRNRAALRRTFRVDETDHAPIDNQKLGRTASDAARLIRQIANEFVPSASKAWAMCEQATPAFGPHDPDMEIQGIGVLLGLSKAEVWLAADLANIADHLDNWESTTRAANRALAPARKDRNAR